MERPTSITVIGAGGNIGSHLVPHLGRMHDVEQVTLIDPDVYRPHNLRGQAITARDVGRLKVHVQARCLKRIRPSLRVRVIASRVEAVPLGRLRAGVVLACLDTRASRQWVNEAARHLGVPWIDAGVDGPGLVARVSVFPAGPQFACLECGWSQADYDALEQVYACTGNVASVPTNAPAAVGALAAALQAIECQKLLEGGAPHAATQTFLDMRARAHFVTRLQRNPACRLTDHAPWTIAPVHARTLADVFAAAEAAGFGAARAVGAGRAFARRLRCVDCGQLWEGLHLQDVETSRCRRCAGPQAAAALDLESNLVRARLSKRDLTRSVRGLGLRDGDVVRVGCEHGVATLEVGVAARTALAGGESVG